MKNITALILAAGKSSRFWPLNTRHKSLFKIMGRPLIWYTLEGLRRAGINDIIIVQGKQKDVETELKPFSFFGMRIKYIVQAEPKGMGNAMWQARAYLKTSFLVLNAERIDAGEILKKTKIIAAGKAPALLGQKTNNSELYGIFRLKGNRALEIIEKPQKGKAPSDIRVVGIYWLEPKFFQYYAKVKKETYDFEMALSEYMRAVTVRVTILDRKNGEILSLKYPWHLFKFEKYLFDRELKPHISKTAKIAKSAAIEGRVYVGERTRIMENAAIKGPCYIGNDCLVGNNALIRDYADLENGAVVGANGELTHSVFQEDVHCHSGFFGDSIFDRNCRVGAGTVTANVRLDRGRIKPYIDKEKTDSGLDSLGAIVGEEAHIGIHTSFMPGILVGANCVIGSSTVVRENVPENTLLYSEFTQQSKRRK
ncbi:MAG: Bifunctional protein GlmU [Parcubacteria group bacterium GW2011_GWA2_47_9]|nr:MAG: Bifunctional protein GlmU [Parcubacteria group bacterium GW2011_GWA2_47_9]